MTPNKTHSAPQWMEPAHLSKLLTAAAENNHELGVGLALEAFAGLRFAELLQLDWSEIQDQHAWVESGASRSSHRGRSVTIQKNLQSWLEPHLKAKGRIISLSPSVWRNRVAASAANAGLTPPTSTALRNSFAVYHFCRFHDAERTSIEMGWSPRRDWSTHLLRPIGDHDVTAYWAIVPKQSI